MMKLPHLLKLLALASVAGNPCPEKNSTIIRVLMPSSSYYPYYRYLGGIGNEGRFDGCIPALYKLIEHMSCLRMVMVTGETIGWEVLLDEQSVPGGFNTILSSTLSPLTNSPNVRITSPLLSTYTTGIVKKWTDNQRFFAMFDPFTRELWGMLAFAMFMCAGTVVLIEALQLQDKDGSTDHEGPCSTLDLRVWMRRAIRYGDACYQMWALLLGGEAESIPITASARLLRLSINLIILVLVATVRNSDLTLHVQHTSIRTCNALRPPVLTWQYTANLAAFFNKPTVKIG